MAIDYDKLMNWKFDSVESEYTSKDSILYALGVGLSADPLDMDQLRFTYEEDQLALPTMAVVLAYPGFFLKDPQFGVDWVKVLHGEQGIEIHKQLPAAAKVIGENRFTEIIDKGEGRGALLFSERKVYEKSTGDLLATLTSTTFARGDGGFGGPAVEAPKPHTLPDRAPDTSVEMPTLPQAALIYRLSGDFNPLHADPRVATAAGFEKPILHGLATLGVAGHALLKETCDYDPSRFKSLKLRFTSPVYPGETIVTEMWKDGSEISFRAKVKERDVVVLNNGRAIVE
ncbi:3-alpha,7-alpha,12-alpha-trihydroxy-5-beta-cholest-24-enoyl-CoA hydratase [Sneathiella sp. P13V-1]|uniref:MaoC/PaaZ C-terminal domain-containing protein n=1 Tax=Sneathiella sp. P13V-1 TaxID=2697366 RepID=UPI00187BA5B8|nr:MaoC/PaaZ C-terminal domain-containing protein [Sneathiella sp. P13V-1]MBE7637796.1 3-alpha,7-alpha,12-alpha-trihydroxy-5-beta-cholest-24-enoyl-CoA hydratase [Sneathiella sp. P13V-1]